MPDDRSLTPQPTITPAQPGPRARLLGIDLARGLAIIGMLTVHTGVVLFSGRPAELMYQLSQGRSAILFAFLAGVSIALMSGRDQPLEPGRVRMARVKIAVRAAILLVLGLVLAALDSGVAVILQYYGIYFLFALPLLRLRAATLATLAAVLAVVGPQLSFLVRWAFEFGPLPWSWLDAIDAVDPLATFGHGVIDLLLMGDYPTLSFLPLVVGGMAVGRLQLIQQRVQLFLLAVGSGLAIVGYGLSWLALGPTNASRSAEMYGFVPADDPAWLLVDLPHSGTTFEIIGSGGVAIAVLGGCLLVAERLRILVFPITSIGMMPLTVYTGSVVFLALTEFDGSPLAVIDERGFLAEVTIAGALLIATLWRLALDKGPLERMLTAAASRVAVHTQGRPVNR